MLGTRTTEITKFTFVEKLSRQGNANLLTSLGLRRFVLERNNFSRTLKTDCYSEFSRKVVRVLSAGSCEKAPSIKKYVTFAENEKADSVASSCRTTVVGSVDSSDTVPPSEETKVNARFDLKLASLGLADATPSSQNETARSTTPKSILKSPYWRRSNTAII